MPTNAKDAISAVNRMLNENYSGDHKDDIIAAAHGGKANIIQMFAGSALEKAPTFRQAILDSYPNAPKSS